MAEASDILILSNGPGEIATWVKPVVSALRRRLGSDRQQLRISVVLAPCPNATGQEAETVRQFAEVDRVQAAGAFNQFLLWGKTVENWDWHDRGLVLFLGGDQFFAVVIGKRLGYRVVTYAEWAARWVRWVDRIAAMNQAVVEAIPAGYRSKATIVGDLMLEAAQFDPIVPQNALANPLLPQSAAPERKKLELLVGLLPGSKGGKLQVGVPFLLAIAREIYQRLPDVQFMIPVAPTTDVATIARYADPALNPIVDRFQWQGAERVVLESVSEGLWAGQPPTPALQVTTLETRFQVPLVTQFPAYDLLRQCQLCLTTIGANTAELGALGVPMLVLLPTQQWDAMKAWDGLPGILANLPGIGSGFVTVYNQLMCRWLGLLGNGDRRRLLAWPNIWAGEMIVPELVGRLQVEKIAEQAVESLTHPEMLDQIRDRLRQVRGEAGAADRLAQIVQTELAST